MFNLDRITDWVAGQSWIGPAEKPLQEMIAALYRAGGKTGARIKDFWNGVWLGHPLHAVLTDIPIGAWTAGVAMDALDSQKSNRMLKAGADAAFTVGLLGAAGAVVAGATDWQYLTGRSRRIGLVHASLNITAILLFGLSLIFRANKQRQTGRALALAGFTTILASGYLGGDMAFRQKVGANHAPLPEDLPHTFTSVFLQESDLKENQLHRAFVNGIPIVLVKQGDRIFALAETCAHLGGPLADGMFNPEDVSVTCPWHASRYRFEDGSIINGPTTYQQPCFEVRIQNGQVEVMGRSPQGA